MKGLFNNSNSNSNSPPPSQTLTRMHVVTYADEVIEFILEALLRLVCRLAPVNRLLKLVLQRQHLG